MPQFSFSDASVNFASSYFLRSGGVCSSLSTTSLNGTALALPNLSFETLGGRFFFLVFVIVFRDDLIEYNQDSEWPSSRLGENL